MEFHRLVQSYTATLAELSTKLSAWRCAVIQLLGVYMIEGEVPGNLYSS